MGSTTDNYILVDSDGFRAFELPGLASETPTPTGTREDLVLLSWLIVLLKTREDGQASFDWAYNRPEDGGDTQKETQPVESRQLSSDQVMAGLDSKVGDVIAAIARTAATETTPSPCTEAPAPRTLLLSTGSLARTPEGGKDEGLLHLEVRFSQDQLKIRPVWRSGSVLDYTERRHIESLVDTIELCLASPDATVSECLRPTTHDLDTIWGWNHVLPPTYDFCMHDMISEVARRLPNKVAIDSWDGSLTYGEIERWSTLLAGSLRDAGVALHDFVPLCFEKSRWTIVAVLAVMKAGATMVMMDPTLPVARLQNMGTQVSARVMVSSQQQHDLAREILPEGTHFTVDEATFASLPADASLPVLPPVPVSALMYIIFTSGSTGTPKGVKIGHGTYSSSAIPRAAAVGYTETSRVLDFAAYAFDVSIDSMLLTLGNGGCLCIPSDDDRLNDINGVIRRMRVNYAGITPSVARILDPDVVLSLTQGLGLGGEAASARDVTAWGRDTRIIIGYGPCECTIGCTVNSSAATGRDYISIGPGNGAAMWIVDPNDHETLMPVGAVGELLVEGPIVGQGYLNDDEKTAAAFIHDPAWLVAGHKGYPGRRGRLYKTGDLGIFDPFGSGEIVFVGRKDTQVKLRGQRVELGEIESQLKDRLPAGTNVIAEVIVPKGGKQASLVAFVTAQPATTTSKDGNQQPKPTEIELAPPSDDLRVTLEAIDAELEKVLPRYMIPTVYVPVNFIPTLISGKTDRKRLRQFGTTVDLRELDRERHQNQDTDDVADATTAPGELTDLERRLREAWAATLNVDAAGIRPGDNFFALGGDSLAAMKLVPVCRARGLDLAVTSTFGHPTLSGMARVVKILASAADGADGADPKSTPPAAFSMIADQHVERACAQAARACATDRAAVQDMYPCTPTQESLFTFSLKSASAYVAQRVARIPAHIPLDAWARAWEAVVAASPILRTRVVQVDDVPGLQQVVLDQPVRWHRITTAEDGLAAYLDADGRQKMNLGESLARYALVEEADGGQRYMVWTVHHVLYDGWSEPLILANVHAALQGQGIEPRTEIRDLVRHLRDDTDASAVQDFWRRELKGAVGPQFPRTPSRDFLPTPDGLVEREVALPSLEGGGGLPFTLATYIRAAWALVASQYTSSDDVVFGETLTGRDIALPGVETILGPLVATVPIRVRIDRASSVSAYLRAVQDAILSRTPYQHAGWQNIRKVSADAQQACEAGTGLVIQPESAPEEDLARLGFSSGDVVREALHFNPYPLMVACGLRAGGKGFRVCASFDSSIIEVAQMGRILAQLETACGRLMKADLEARVGEVSCLPDAELSQIWRWNETPPLTVDEAAGKLRANTSVTKQGAVYPRAVVPWVCDPRNSALLSPIGCPGELWLEGNLFSGAEERVSPAWLVAGSSVCEGRQGKVQSTGDMVQSREDGTLVFVGRKEDVVPVQGHAVDIGDLEAHVATHLAPEIRSAAAVFQPASSGTDGQQVPEREVVVFIELPASSKEDSVEFLPAKQDVSWATSETQTLTTALCASIPISLAVSLKRFDKFVQNSLASHQAPSAYAVVDKLPTTETGEVDHSQLTQLASQIPRDTLDQLRSGLQAMISNKSLTTADLSAAERTLRTAWSKILGIQPEEQIDVDDNFFRLGGDSVLAMKLVSSLRAQGHALTVAHVFQHMRLGDAAKALRLAKSDTDTTPARPAYVPFSLLASDLDRDTFLSEHIRPRLANPAWTIQDILPVTDSQALDVRATTTAPRTSMQYTTLCFPQGSVYRKQLLRACGELARTHEILRTVFVEQPDGSGLVQVVLSADSEGIIPVVNMQTADSGTDLETSVADLCRKDIETDFPLGSSFFRLFHVQGRDKGGDEAECLVLALSHAQYDGVSLPRLLRDLETAYLGGDLAGFEPFSRYMALVRDGEAQAKAAAYWTGLLSGSSLSVLDGAKAAAVSSTEKAVFKTKSVVDNDKAGLALGHITRATLATAAWAVVLSRRLATADVTFGSVTSGRNVDPDLVPAGMEVENVVGPCYQLTPVRVPISAGWTATELLDFVQRQAAESAGYDFLGFDRIARHCGTRWRDGMFDSVVHHQDHEDFDTMPFAGGECRVDVVNPHGDAAYPLKAVSYVKEGKLVVGVVGGESAEAFVDEVLGEFAAAVERLVGGSL